MTTHPPKTKGLTDTTIKTAKPTDNRTKYRVQRHKMMQHWSDYLDGLQVDNVVNIHFSDDTI